MGFKLRYLDLGEGFASLPDTSLVAREQTFTANPKALIVFGRAVAKGYVVSAANPAAAVKISWKSFPEAEPKNISAEEALCASIKVNQARTAIWTSPKTGGALGKFVDEDRKRLIEHLKEQGEIAQDISLSEIYTNEFIPHINDFDRGAIARQAEAFNTR